MIKTYGYQTIILRVQINILEYICKSASISVFIWKLKKSVKKVLNLLNFLEKEYFSFFFYSVLIIEAWLKDVGENILDDLLTIDLDRIKTCAIKWLLLIHKALHNRTPPYLADLLHRHNLSHTHSSYDANFLMPPHRTKHLTWGDRAFLIAAPSLWNSLPKHIRDCTDLNTFKTLTKAHLFKL